MKLFFIRHGQSASNATWDASGIRRVRIDDPALTDVGRAQAGQVAENLGAWPDPEWHPTGITRVYTSLMLRAVATGAIVAPALGAPLVAWVDTHEVGGLYVEDEATSAFVSRPGKGRAFFARQFPQLSLPPELGDAGWWFRPFEDDDARPARARRVWESLLARHAEDTVALITHLGFYNQIMAIALGLPPPHRSQVWFDLDNGAITCLDTRKGVHVARANQACVGLPAARAAIARRNKP